MKKVEENPHQRKKKTRVIKWSALVLIVVLITLIFLYLSDYYEADDSVQVALSDGDTVTVTMEGSRVVFMPTERKSDTGIIFYPGGKVDELAYAPLLRELAEEGIPCILVGMPFRLAVLRSGAASAVIEAYPDIEHWYVGGHSLGGAMAASFAANNAEKLEGVILLAAYPPSDLSESDLRLLSIYGDQDFVLNMERYKASQSSFPVDSVELIIDGGNHAYFGDYGEQSGDGQAQISASEQQQITFDEIVAFLDR